MEDETPFGSQGRVPLDSAAGSGGLLPLRSALHNGSKSSWLRLPLPLRRLDTSRSYSARSRVPRHKVTGCTADMTVPKPPAAADRPHPVDGPDDMAKYPTHI